LDHCALILKDTKPFRYLNVWQKDIHFRELIRTKWESYVIKGISLLIVSKILSSRLKRLLDKVIDSRQSDFLEGRGLLDSVLVASETLEEVKRKKKECVVFKVDLKRHMI